MVMAIRTGPRDYAYHDQCQSTTQLSTSTVNANINLVPISYSEMDNLYINIDLYPDPSNPNPIPNSHYNGPNHLSAAVTFNINLTIINIDNISTTRNPVVLNINLLNGTPTESLRYARVASLINSFHRSNNNLNRRVDHTSTNLNNTFDLSQLNLNGDLQVRHLDEHGNYNNDGQTLQNTGSYRVSDYNAHYDYYRQHYPNDPSIPIPNSFQHIDDNNIYGYSGYSHRRRYPSSPNAPSPENLVIIDDTINVNVNLNEIRVGTAMVTAEDRDPNIDPRLFHHCYALPAGYESR